MWRALSPFSSAGTSTCTDYSTQEDCPPMPSDWSVPELEPCWTDEDPNAHLFFSIGDFGLSTSYCVDYTSALIDSFAEQFGDLEFGTTAGDNDYWSGDADAFDANVGQYFGDYYPANGASSPEPRFWPCLGNHDWTPANITDLADSLPYLNYFAYLQEQNCPDGTLCNYYHVEAIPGILDIFALNSNLGTETSDEYVAAFEEMQIWTQQALESSTAAFKLVTFHHPWYSTAKHDPLSEFMNMPFEEWGASLVIQGHEHAYERIIQPDHNGLTYILNGLGGHPWLYEIHDCDYVQPGSQVRYNDMHGAMVGRVSEDELTMCFYSIKGDKIDSFTLSP